MVDILKNTYQKHSHLSQNGNASSANTIAMLGSRNVVIMERVAGLAPTEANGDLRTSKRDLISVAPCYTERWSRVSASP